MTAGIEDAPMQHSPGVGRLAFQEDKTMAEIEDRDDHGPRPAPEPAESRTGMAKFLGLSLGLWTLVIAVAAVFLVVILVYAL
jgi:hypothetical protein